jgi:hypothetical protein
MLLIEHQLTAGLKGRGGGGRQRPLACAAAQKRLPGQRAHIPRCAGSTSTICTAGTQPALRCCCCWCAVLPYADEAFLARPLGLHAGSGLGQRAANKDTPQVVHIHVKGRRGEGPRYCQRHMLTTSTVDGGVPCHFVFPHVTAWKNNLQIVHVPCW